MVFIKFSFRNIRNISTWKTEALKGGGGGTLGQKTLWISGGFQANKKKYVKPFGQMPV